MCQWRNLLFFLHLTGMCFFDKFFEVTERWLETDYSLFQLLKWILLKCDNTVLCKSEFLSLKLGKKVNVRNPIHTSPILLKKLYTADGWDGAELSKSAIVLKLLSQSVKKKENLNIKS